MKKTVLCFVIDRERKRLLMIHKKRGQGAGKWNVPGGKIQAGESTEAAAIRETQEETGITPSALKQIGQLEFHFKGGNSWDNSCSVFIAESFSGTVVAENDECTATWVPFTQIPYEKMWESDRAWAPLVFRGEFFHRAYTFDSNDKVIEEKDLHANK